MKFKAPALARNRANNSVPLVPALQVLLRVWLAVLSLVVAAAEQTADISRLGQLAGILNQQSPAVREDFARVAIEEVVMSLQLESELAQMEDAQAGKGQRWSAATRQFARQLALAAQLLDTSTHIRLSVGMEHTVFIHLDDRLVVLSNPRAEEQTAMERRIIERFCSAQPCQDWLGSSSSPTQGPLTSRPPVWTFGDGGFYSCSNSEGLSLQFSILQNMAANKQFCQQLFSELFTLASDLRDRLYNGEDIDWRHLHIENAAGDDHQRVVLNQQGEVIWLVLPTCAAQPKLFAALLPWLKDRVHGVGDALLVEDVEGLLVE